MWKWNPSSAEKHQTINSLLMILFGLCRRCYMLLLVQLPMFVGSILIDMSWKSPYLICPMCTQGVWSFPKMGVPQVTTGFSTDSWSFFLGWFGGRTILGQPHFVSLRSRRLANWTLASHRIRWRQSQRWGAVGREGYDSQRNAKKHTPKREQNTKVLLFFSGITLCYDILERNIKSRKQWRWNRPKMA